MTDEEYDDFVREGWIPIRYNSIRPIRDSTGTEEDKYIALTELFAKHGLGLSGPMRMKCHFDSRTYLFLQDEGGRIINGEDVWDFRKCCR
jgi:hypothetical protein